MAEVGNLKKGDYVVYNGEPYYVNSKSGVVFSRHSGSKTKIEITNVFTGEKKSLTVPDGTVLEDVDIIRKHGQLISMTGEGFGQVMDMKDYAILEASIPKELEIHEGDEITFVEFKGKAHVIELREKK